MSPYLRNLYLGGEVTQILSYLMPSISGRCTGSSMRHLRRLFLCSVQRSEKRRAAESSSWKDQRQRSPCPSSAPAQYLFQPNSRGTSTHRNDWGLLRRRNGPFREP